MSQCGAGTRHDRTAHLTDRSLACSALTPGAFPGPGTLRVMLLFACSDSRWPCRTACALFVGNLFALFPVPPGHTALYSCTDAAGTAVITDSPAQLRHCTLLGTGRSAAPERNTPPLDLSSRRAAEPEASRDQTQASVFSVPLERIGSLLVVTIQVNGTRPAKMILDTGASHTILSYAVARDLGLWSLHRSASMTMHTAGGTVQAEILPIASITIGGAVVRNIEAVIHDLPEAPPDIEGLLGLNVLHHFTVTLDTARNRLLLGVHP